MVVSVKRGVICVVFYCSIPWISLIPLKSVVYSSVRMLPFRPFLDFSRCEELVIDPYSPRQFLVQ